MSTRTAGSASVPAAVVRPRRSPGEEPGQAVAAVPRPREGGCPEFELVVVSYRSRAQIAGLLAELPHDLPVVVVDNASNSDGVRELVLDRPQGRYVDGGGHGFATAANLGASTSRFQYLVFGNPDSRPTIDDLSALVADVSSDPLCASSAAMVVGADGRAELGAAGWEPSLVRSLVHAVGLHKLAPRAGLFARPEPGSHVAVDWTTGACMAVRRESFLEMGGFDERYYVYNEDVAFGRRVRELGMQQRLRTDVLVPHATGGSGAPSREMLRLRGASMSRYVRQYNREPAAAGITFALALGYVVRAVAALSRQDRSLAAGYAEYVRGVLTGRADVAGRPVYEGVHRPSPALTRQTTSCAECGAPGRAG